MRTITLNTPYEIGEVVIPVCKPDDNLIVIGFQIDNVDKNGNVLNYFLKCSDAEGRHLDFYPVEIMTNGKENNIFVFDADKFQIGDLVKLALSNDVMDQFVVVGFEFFETRKNVVGYHLVMIANSKGDNGKHVPSELQKILMVNQS